MATNTQVFKALAPRMMRDLMRDFAPLTDFQAAAIVGNGGGESGGFTLAFEGAPSVAGSKGGSGFFQWTGFTPNNNRRKVWEDFLRKRGLDPARKEDVLNYDANYAMLFTELRGTERATIPALRKTTNLTDATREFMRVFERPGIPHIEGRINWAKTALEAYKIEQAKIAKDPAKNGGKVPEGTVKPGAPADGVPKPKDNNKGFWGTAVGSVGAALVATYNFLLEWLPWVVLAVGIVLFAIYVLRPAYVRWRDYLSQAPEFADADFKTRFRVLFSGFKTKMLARATEATGALVLALNTASNLTGSGMFDINDYLPAIPIAKSIALQPSQYLFAGMILIGRANDWLRSISKTEEGTVDPALAVAVASNSRHVEGSMPSDALAAVTDQSQLTELVAPLTVIKTVAAKVRKSKKRRRKTGRM